MSSFVIEKNIPIPPQTRGGVKGGSKWKPLEIGDSVFLPAAKGAKFGGVLTNARRATGYRFTQRQVEGGVRVWPDEKTQAAIVEAASAFEETVAEKLRQYRAAEKVASVKLIPTERRVYQEMFT